MKFDVVTGKQSKPVANAPQYTAVFAKALIAEAEADKKIVAITAAMPSGTGLDKFAERFPERHFDVGIAEQHGVTFAAGLASEGFKPFAAIYSTFLQRGYDQVVHDVAIQNLPVRFAIDRAGLVGADGATHAGSFDVAYLGCLPDFVVMAAADELELMHMVATAAADRRPALAPSAIRAARASASSCRRAARRSRSARAASCARAPRSRILSFGTRLGECLKAAEDLARQGAVDHGGRCALRQAARHRPDPPPGARARGADHHRGGLGRRLRQPGAAVPGEQRACSITG